MINTFANLDFIENHKFTVHINQRLIVNEGDSNEVFEWSQRYCIINAWS